MQQLPFGERVCVQFSPRNKNERNRIVEALGFCFPNFEIVCDSEKQKILIVCFASYIEGLSTRESWYDNMLYLFSGFSEAKPFFTERNRKNLGGSDIEL